MKKEELWEQLFKQAFSSEVSPRDELNRVIINEAILLEFKAKCMLRLNEAILTSEYSKVSGQEEEKDLKKTIVPYISLPL